MKASLNLPRAFNRSLCSDAAAVGIRHPVHMPNRLATSLDGLAPCLPSDRGHSVAPGCARRASRTYSVPTVVASAIPARHLVTASASASSDTAVASGSGATIRRIIMLRHADSDGPSSGVRDHDREISDKGKREAAAIAKKLVDMGWKPDLVLASNSKRTKQTLDEMANMMPELSDVDTHLYGSLYTVAALDGQTRKHIEECLLEVVDDKRHQCVMCVGHNKGWEEAASSMAGKPVSLETACAALLEASEPWKSMLHVVEPEGPVSSVDESDSSQVGSWSLVEVATPDVA